MNYDRMQNMNVDPVIVQRIQSDPNMCAEQGDFMGDYGGPSNYIQLAKLPVDQRLVMAAKMDGYTDPADIATVTGLSDKQVSTALNSLVKGGVISQSDATPLA